MTHPGLSLSRRRLFAVSLAAALMASLVPLASVFAAGTLSFSQQPGGGATGGVAFPTQPKVHAANPGPTGGVSVTLSITPGTGTAGATLTCTGGNSKSTVAITGDATFAGCSIDKAGTGYQLTASATGYTSVDSTAFDVGVGPATQLAFLSYPATNTPALLNPQPTVAVRDAGGNLVTAGSHPIKLTINKHVGQFTCSGGTTMASVNGLANFSGCTETVIDTNYTLTASTTDPGISSTTGPNLNVTSGPAAGLQFSWGTAAVCNTT